MRDPFSSIIGHETVLKLLAAAVAHPGHAYLFFGPAGTGKRLAARAFASAVLKVSEESLDAHPDFISVRREEGAKHINVEQARELMARMLMTSAAGGHRVALLEGADFLNIQAANALLKIVEEAPKETVYLFVAEDPQALPVTLRSRLAPVSFGRVPTRLIAEWLKGRGADAATAEALAAEAAGRPGVALDMLADPNHPFRDSREFRELLEALRTAPLGGRMAALERLAKTCEASPDPEEEWRGRLSALMRAVFLEGDPADQARVAEGLILAWRYTGSALSPRIGLEWTAVRPYRIGNRLIPSSLLPSYL